MMNFLQPRFVRAALAGLCLAAVAAAIAQSAASSTKNPDTVLNDALVCAAGVHCRSDLADAGLTPQDAVKILGGFDDEKDARKHLDEMAKQWPDEVWRCAATGKHCPKGISQQDAQDQIPMDPEVIAEVNKYKSKGKKPKIEVEHPGPTQPVENPDGISVEVNEPGPPEITLQPPAQEIQPLDGTWSLVHGATGKEGNCPAMLMNAVGNVGAEANDTRALSFSKPFHPNSISGPEGSWQRVGPNHWRSAHSADGGAGKLTTDLYVMSPSLMRGEIVMEFNIPGQCRHVLTTPYTHQRQG